MNSIQRLKLTRAAILVSPETMSLQAAPAAYPYRYAVDLAEDQTMPENRAFSEENIPMKADDYHGLANYVRTQPNVAEKGVESVNIEMTFEEAIRFSLAVQSCVMQLNRY